MSVIAMRDIDVSDRVRLDNGPCYFGGGYAAASLPAYFLCHSRSMTPRPQITLTS
jgi:hypothetical protein